MFRFVSIFFVAAIGAAGYFFYTTSNTLTDETQSSAPSNETTSSKDSSVPQSTVSKASPEPAPVALPKLTQAETKQAQAHVKSITTAPEKPIEIKKADHFVTAEQVLELPELQAEIIKIETVNEASSETPKQVDVIVSAPVKENEQVSLAQTNQNNAQAAQSFAVKIPSFKKSTSSEPATLTSDSSPAASNTSTPSSVSSKATSKAVSDSASIATGTQTIENATQPKQSQNIAKSEPVKILTTVTGTAEEPAEVIAVKVNPVKVTPVVVKAKTNIEQNESTESTESIIGALKKNLEEISDIKVSELASLVTSTPNTSTASNTANNSAPQVTTVKTQILSTDDTTTAANSTNKPSNNTQTIELAQNAKSVKVGKAQNAVSTQSEKNRIKLKELLNDTDSDKKRIFYLHAVNATDEQGIWGIIQKGLTGTFSKGISLSQANGTIRTLIPDDADEMLSNKNSSFLGKLLNYKVLTTYVYNYEKGNIGKNPDYIKPGQQLIIVTFTEEELMSIYQHFKNAQ